MRCFLLASCLGLTQSVAAWVAAPRKIASRVSLSASTVPSLTGSQLDELRSNQYIILQDFIPPPLQSSLRSDIQNLRQASKFNIAKIGEGATNALNDNIRVAETCFLGPGKLNDVPSTARQNLYDIIDQVRGDLERSSGQALDGRLTELLYAYYPQGGFYRRHRDALPGSTSNLRRFSFLLYLNEDWDAEKDGGCLRMHMDGGGDVLPEGATPNFRDISPDGGTLVVFASDAIPHEVLDTRKERMAVVGWFNRPVSMDDLTDLSGGGVNPVMLGVAAALVTVGLVNLIAG